MKKKLIILLVLFLLIFSETSARNGDGGGRNRDPVDIIGDFMSSEFLSGDDCLDAHSFIYIYQTSAIKYEGFSKVDEQVNFTISFQKAVPGIEFKVSSRLILSDNLSMISREPNRDILLEDDFQLTFFVTANTSGNFMFTILSNVTVHYTETHPEYDSLYQYNHTAMFATDLTGGSAEAIVESDIITEIPFTVDWNRFAGQVLGIIATLSAYFTIQLGMPVRKKKIGKKLKMNASRMKRLHRDMGYLTMGSIMIHLVLTSQTIWSSFFNFYTIWPQFLSLQDWNDTNLGLDLGAISGLIFLISGLTGLYYRKIVRSIGRDNALITQQISYLALAIAVYHAILNGGLTRNITILAIIQIIMIIEVLISRTAPYLVKKGIITVRVS